MNNTSSTTGTLTLFSIPCCDRYSEYGHLYIVAANSEAEAEDVILADMRRDYHADLTLAEVRDQYDFKVYEIDSKSIGTTEYGDGPRVVSQFRT